MNLERKHNNTTVEELYANHRNDVVGYLIKRGMHLHDAEDMAQNAILKIMDKAGDYDYLAPGLFKVSAWRLMANLKRDRRSHPDLELSFEIDEPNVTNYQRPPEDIVIKKQEKQEEELQLQRLMLAIDELPETQRDVVLRKLQGDSAVEIAENMEKSEGAIKQLYHRACNKLAIFLNHEA